MNETMRRVVRGDPGAQAVYFALLHRWPGDIETLLRLDITGPELWILYKDCCNGDSAAVHASLLLEGAAIELLRRRPKSKFYTEEQ